LTQNEIANLAFDAVGKSPKISHIPDWMRKIILKIAKLFMNSKKFGPIEFFLNVMAVDMVAPEHGKHTLKDYFNGLGKR
ncbi:MAG: SDR family NAD(P)-dependent oxidoreductase, partial [Ignavibacteriae bacterium]